MLTVDDDAPTRNLMTERTTTAYAGCCSAPGTSDAWSRIDSKPHTYSLSRWNPTHVNK